MIKIDQPAMALNSHDVPQPWYKMENTRIVTPDVGARDLLNNVASVLADFRSRFPGRRRTLVINCHGAMDQPLLDIGKGIRKADAVHFGLIAPYVDEILIAACFAGSHLDFMGAIAKNAKATVKAGVQKQYTNYSDSKDKPCLAYFPPGFIDDWDGPLMTFNGFGSLANIENAGP
ncbi:hypothetical protein [Methylobacterium nodulans]|uniref:DUF4347 domain-containing protein n=1 Tax=Methylobacterium nodulans (strain LMG 21967 / CNCM I-2342 / ORS 2060) TaxID=460265 RepID=B8II55_METNO|nr:hypothetical protein [Methylobacterium nodulans]ACL57924.1 hypothetical protein Mnod_2974 [Methylobacterium nodulans ORS 2060]